MKTLKERASSGIKLGLAMSLLCSFGFAIFGPVVGIDTQSEDARIVLPQDVDGLLSYFCDRGCLVDRGVCHTPFAPGATKWITNHLESTQPLQKFLGLSEKQVAMILDDTESEPVGNSAKDPALVSPLDRPGDAILGDRLWAAFNKTQQEKLLALYLNHEGLMALRRERLGSRVGLTTEKRKELAKISLKHFSHANREIHQRVFVMKQEDLQHVPKLNLKARLLSTELDVEILKLLTKTERENLTEIVRLALTHADVLRGPGIGP